MQEVAKMLGVSPLSIQRWVDSGKLKSNSSIIGEIEFSIEHLKEFALKYNISMGFLDTVRLKGKKGKETPYSSIAVVR